MAQKIPRKNCQTKTKAWGCNPGSRVQDSKKILRSKALGKELKINIKSSSELLFTSYTYVGTMYNVHIDNRFINKSTMEAIPSLMFR